MVQLAFSFSQLQARKTPVCSLCTVSRDRPMVALYWINYITDPIYSKAPTIWLDL